MIERLAVILNIQISQSSVMALEKCEIICDTSAQYFLKLFAIEMIMKKSVYFSQS